MNENEERCSVTCEIAPWACPVHAEAYWLSEMDRREREDDGYDGLGSRP